MAIIDVYGAPAVNHLEFDAPGGLIDYGYSAWFDVSFEIPDYLFQSASISAPFTSNMGSNLWFGGLWIKNKEGDAIEGNFSNVFADVRIANEAHGAIATYSMQYRFVTHGPQHIILDTVEVVLHLKEYINSNLAAQVIGVGSLRLLSDIQTGNSGDNGGDTSDEGSELDYDVSDAQRHIRAFQRGGGIFVQYGANVSGNTWSGVNTGIAGSRPCIRFAKTGQQQRLWLVFDDGTNVYRTYSENEGATWSMPVTIGTGTNPTLVVTRHKVQYVYWISGTSVKGKVYDDVDNVLVDEFTAVAAGVDDSKISAKEHIRASGEWHMKLLYTAAGTITSVDSVDGVNFS